ncbi:MAG TPA: VCBS repeat-containing protein [Candidatus Binatia bacterium]|nr:VCBS repeat-containing protein [Candidatus Binatia bacterium]
MRAVCARMTLVGLLWPSLVLAQVPVFDTAMSTSVGGNPVAVAVGDADGDGHLDVVTANFDTANVSLLFGDGSGELFNGGNFAAGTVPGGLAMGLFNGDDVPDLIVSNANVAQLSFLQGTRNPDDCPQGQPACFILTGDPIQLPGYCSGDPTQGCDPTILDAQHRDQCTLAGKGVCNAVGGPGGIAVGNLNGDAFLDLAVAAEGNGDGDGTLSILFGKGDGTFDAQPALAAGSGTMKAVIADFNGDNKNDVAVINAKGNSVTVFLGDGAGHFGTALTSAIGVSPSGVAAGDFDEDSQTDLAVTYVSASGEGILLLKGDGHGNFATAGTFVAGAFPSDIVAADLNRDHHLDLIASNKRSADTSVLFGDGHGGFSRARTFVTNGDPLTVGVADLNEDGFPDVLTGDGLGQQQGDLAVLLNEQNTRFVGVEDFHVGGAVTAVVAGDVNDDSLPDAAVALDPMTVRIYLAATLGDFVVAGDLHVGDTPRALNFGDFNRDGELDLAVVSSGSDTATSSTLSLFLGKGNGTFNDALTTTTTARAVASVVGDFDNNRIPDVAVVSLGNPGVVSILLGNGNGTFRAGGTINVGDTPLAIATGSFNGDAFQDLLVANSVSNDVSVLLGNGDGTVRSGGLVGTGNGPVGIAVFDVNRDGFDDFAVAQSTAQNVFVYTGDGTGTFKASSACQQPTGCTVGNSPSGLVARDFNGDGRPDLAVSNQVSNTVSLLTSSNTGRLSRTAEIVISRQPKAITGADFTGGGNYDVLTGNSSTALNLSRLTNSGGTAVLRGDGNGDGRVGAADLIAAVLEVSDGDTTRPEDVGRLGYMPSPCVNGVCGGRGVDANGDGIVTPQDIRATAIRIFIGS